VRGRSGRLGGEEWRGCATRAFVEMKAGRARLGGEEGRACRGELQGTEARGGVAGVRELTGGFYNHFFLGDRALGSAQKMVKRGGEWVAIAHKMEKTGFKATNAYGSKKNFSGLTTNREFQGSVKVVGTGTHEKSGTKKLMPYKANASRNRPKETMKNTVGRRFGVGSVSKTESYRGSSQVQLKDGDPRGNFWKTTNQAYNECAQVKDTIGLSNMGISAQVAKNAHKMQQM